MPDKTTWLNAFPPREGWNTARNPLIASLHNLSESKNIMFNTDLTRVQAPGQRRFTVKNGVTDFNFPEVRYLGEFNYRNASNNKVSRIIKISGQDINADTGQNGVFEPITGSTLFNPEDRITSDVIANQMIICSQNAVPLTYTGTGTVSTLSGSPPNGSLCRAHMGRLRIAGVDATPDLDSYSNAFQPTVWTGFGTGTLEIDTDNSDPEGITSYFPSFLGELYVAKRNGIYQIAGTTPGTFQVLPVIQGFGCVNQNTIAQVHNDTIFVSSRGVHSLAATLNGAVTEESFLSFPIQSYWTENVNLNRINKMWGAFLSSLNSYILLFASGSKDLPDNALLFNIPLKVWYLWENFDASSIIEITKDNRKRILVGRNDGIITYLDSEERTNLGGGIHPKLKVGPFFMGGSPTVDAAVKHIRVAYQSPQNASLEVQYKVDNFTPSTVTMTPTNTGIPLGPNFILGTTNLGGGAAATISTVSAVGHGSVLTLQMQKPVTNPLGPNFILGTTPLTNADTTLSILGHGVEVEGIEEKKAEVSVT